MKKITHTQKKKQLEDMEEEKKQRGGRRTRAGRPTKGKKILIAVRVSEEAHSILQQQANKSEYIDELIIRDKKRA